MDMKSLGNFVPAKSTIPGIQLYMPAPQVERHQKVVQFRCLQCNAETAYSAADGGLTCTYCGHYEPPPKQVVGKGAEEFEFTVETVERAAHGWGLEREELECQTCGALTAVPPGDLTHICPFCASTHVVQRQAPQETLRPRFLIPLALDQDRCREIVREWLGSSWMTPAGLQQMARTADFTPIYIPYWTFDANSDASWQAQVAHQKSYRRYNSSRKKWETRTKTEWKWESGQVNLFIDDLPVAGTERPSQLLLQRLQPFNLHDLVVYKPDYLAGVQAQAYDVTLDKAWEKARQQMRQRTKQACQAQASSSRLRNFSMNLDFSDESWRYILLPIYVAAYRYGERTYQVLINGQTGRLSGQRPVDWRKVGLAVAGVLSPGVLLGLVMLILTASGRSNGLVFLFAMLLLLAGVAATIALVHKARQLDDI